MMIIKVIGDDVHDAIEYGDGVDDDEDEVDYGDGGDDDVDES